MVKARTPEEMAQYQKDRRARIAASKGHVVPEQTGDPPKLPTPQTPVKKRITSVSKRAAAVVVIEDGRAAVREFKGVSGYRYLPGDEVIGKMTQKQRDIIMAKLPKTASRTR